MFRVQYHNAIYFWIEWLNIDSTEYQAGTQIIHSMID